MNNTTVSIFNTHSEAKQAWNDMGVTLGIVKMISKPYLQITEKFTGNRHYYMIASSADKMCCGLSIDTLILENIDLKEHKNIKDCIFPVVLSQNPPGRILEMKGLSYELQ